jgi:hypothetical protein
MRGPTLLFISAFLVNATAHAQVTWQPASHVARAGSYPGIPLYTQASAPRTQPPSATRTSGRTSPRPTGTSGRVTVTNAPSPTKPKGINGAWVEYDGRRWVTSGKAVDLSPEFKQVGEYRGFPVYQRRGDPLTIYIPSVGDLVVPFRPRGL